MGLACRLDSHEAPELIARSYYNSLPLKRVLIWGGDEGEGLEMAKA